MFNKKLKQENSRLTQELLDVKQELLYYQNENRVLRDKKDYCDKQVILLNAQVFDLKERLKQTDFDDLNKKLVFSRQELTKINKECHNKSIELNQLKTDLVCLNDKIYIQQLGLYDLPNDIKYYQDELNFIREKEKTILLNKSYYKCKTQWVVNNNSRVGEMLAEFLAKTVITSFNLTSDSLLDKLSISNYENIKERLKRIYKNFNQNLERNDLSLSEDYLKLKLQEIDMMYKVLIKKQQDKEEERLRKEQLKEELLVEKQLNQEKERLEKELLKLQIKKLNMVSSGNGQVDDILNKTIYDIKEKLNINEYRRENTRAGWCYIISNPSFGKGVYKIGISRRDIVDTRISELSGSNVPFVFKPHCIIWSNDCFKLESDLHKDFSAYRVNKLKVHREFFKVPLEQIEKVLNEKYNIYEPFDYSIIDEDFIASNYEIGENFIDKSPKL